jgi:hypothetical protein
MLLLQLADLPTANVVKLLVKKLDVVDAPKLSLADIQNDRENELVIARDDFAEEEMRLFLHATNFRRMRKEASSQEHCPVISMVGPTGAGKSSLIKRLNPIKPPVVAFQEQQIPTTSNVNSFLSAGFDGLGKIRILDLEGDDGGLPLMEYCFRAADHQILTNCGFLYLDEVEALVEIDATTGDVVDWHGLEVASYDAAHDQLLYEQPLRLVRNEHLPDSSVVRLRDASGALDLVVTAEHELYLSLDNAPFSLVRAADVDPSRRIAVKLGAAGGVVAAPKLPLDVTVELTATPQPPLPKGTSLSSQIELIERDTADEASVPIQLYGGVDVSAFLELGLTTAAQKGAFLELYGFWIGERSIGATSGVTFTVRKRRELRFVAERLCAVGWAEHAAVHRDGTSFAFNFIVRLPHVVALLARAHDWLWQLSASGAARVLDGILAAHASVGNAVVVTPSVQLRDDIERLCLHAGFASRSVLATDGAARTHYRVHVSKSRVTETVQALQISTETLSGRTWCFTMPHGFVVARRAPRVLERDFVASEQAKTDLAALRRIAVDARLVAVASDDDDDDDEEFARLLLGNHELCLAVSALCDARLLGDSADRASALHAAVQAALAARDPAPESDKFPRGAKWVAREVGRASIHGNCKNYQHLSSTDYLSADDVSTFVKQVFQHYDEKELTAYMNKRKHVTKHLLPRLCVPEDDHQILTDRGFLFLDEVEALVAIDPASGDVSDWRGLRVANYDVAKQCLVYETPLALVRNDHSRVPTELVEFTDAHEATRWGATNAAGSKPAPRDARRLSVVTTGGHQLFARNGAADAKFAKIKAVDASAKLESGEWSQIEFLAHASNGVSTATTASSADVPPTALLELYGAWLARFDGVVSADGALVLQTASAADVQFVSERVTALGWTVEQCAATMRVRCCDSGAVARSLFADDAWLWTLPRAAAAAIVDGMCGADGDVVTSSAAVRELCVRLCMHAGRTVHFDAVSPREWRVSFADRCDMTFDASELVVRKRLFGGRTWCFDMDDGFIVTRRAHRVAAAADDDDDDVKRRCGVDGRVSASRRWTVTSASRATIQGNCYIMSDVIVYVNTVPAKRESMYLDRVLEFVEKSQTGVSSAEMPSLILVYNQCPKRQKPFDIAEATDHFFVFVDREKKLLESYRTVDFVKIPDWENESLYAQQVTALQKTIAQRVREQHEQKRKNGTLFNDQVWFDILDKVVENFLLEANISMSRIFGKFIISESSLVNRAYAFFHHVYGSSTKKEFFVQERASRRSR